MNDLDADVDYLLKLTCYNMLILTSTYCYRAGKNEYMANC